MELVGLNRNTESASIPAHMVLQEERNSGFRQACLQVGSDQQLGLLES